MMNIHHLVQINNFFLLAGGCFSHQRTSHICIPSTITQQMLCLKLVWAALTYTSIPSSASPTQESASFNQGRFCLYQQDALTELKTLKNPWPFLQILLTCPILRQFVRSWKWMLSWMKEQNSCWRSLRAKSFLVRWMNSNKCYHGKSFKTWPRTVQTSLKLLPSTNGKVI